jgi:microcystin-dependent protein
MATANIQLATPANGSFVGTWDQPVNANTTVIDAVAGSITTKSLTNANVTLSVTEAQVAILRFTGVLTGNCIITLPAIIKSWICENLTTGAFTVKISGSSGNVVALRPGSCQVYWDGTNVQFINLGGVGDYWDASEADTPLWVSSCTVPPALKCDGSTFSSVTYPILNARLGGTTLPDFSGRTAAYLNGGTGRITTAGSGIDGNTRFSAGGAQNITLDATTLPSHTHTVNDPGHTHTSNASNIVSAFISNSFSSVQAIVSNNTATINSATTGISLNSTGSGGAHNNMPPAVISGVRMIWAG